MFRSRRGDEAAPLCTEADRLLLQIAAPSPVAAAVVDDVLDGAADEEDMTDAARSVLHKAMMRGYVLRWREEQETNAAPVLTDLNQHWESADEEDQELLLLEYCNPLIQDDKAFLEVFSGGRRLWKRLVSYSAEEADDALADEPTKMPVEPIDELMRFGYGLRCCEQVVGLEPQLHPDYAAALSDAEALGEATGNDWIPVTREEMEVVAVGISEKVLTEYQAGPPSENLAHKICYQELFGEGRAEAAPDGVRFAMSASFLGYLTRRIEEQDYDAEGRVPDIADALDRAMSNGIYGDWWGAAHNFAARLATELEDPIGGTLAIPGLGPELRKAMIKLQLAALTDGYGGALPNGLSAEEAIQCWAYGFIFRCAEGSVPGGRL